MIILPLKPKQEKYLKDHNFIKKYTKQSLLFLANIYHPSLNFELLEPKELGNYSFRIDIHYRAIIIFHSSDVVEVISINNHYK